MEAPEADKMQSVRAQNAGNGFLELKIFVGEQTRSLLSSPLSIGQSVYTRSNILTPMNWGIVSKWQSVLIFLSDQKDYHLLL